MESLRADRPVPLINWTAILLIPVLFLEQISNRIRSRRIFIHNNKQAYYASVNLRLLLSNLENLESVHRPGVITIGSKDHNHKIIRFDQLKVLRKLDSPAVTAALLRNDGFESHEAADPHRYDGSVAGQAPSYSIVAAYREDRAPEVVASQVGRSGPRLGQDHDQLDGQLFDRISHAGSDGFFNQEYAFQAFVLILRI